MIISCNNCNKKFDIDSDLIPDMGRLLQCASCDHKWFFEKEVSENTVSPIVKDIDNVNVNIFDQNNSLNKEENKSSDIQEEDVELVEEPDKVIEININANRPVNAKPKKQRNFKILNIIIIVIISFVAFIIIVDTFKYPIGKIVPNIEIILYNLYESIKDVSLFIRDLT